MRYLLILLFLLPVLLYGQTINPIPSYIFKYKLGVGMNSGPMPASTSLQVGDSAVILGMGLPRVKHRDSVPYPRIRGTFIYDLSKDSLYYWNGGSWINAIAGKTYFGANGVQLVGGNTFRLGGTLGDDVYIYGNNNRDIGLYDLSNFDVYMNAGGTIQNTSTLNPFRIRSDGSDNNLIAIGGSDTSIFLGTGMRRRYTTASGTSSLTMGKTTQGRVLGNLANLPAVGDQYVTFLGNQGQEWLLYNENKSTTKYWRTFLPIKFPDGTVTDTIPNASNLIITYDVRNQASDTLYALSIYGGTKANPTGGGSGTTYTFENGITEAAGNVKLGGLLTENTIIDGDAQSWDLNLSEINEVLIADAASYRITTDQYFSGASVHKWSGGQKDSTVATFTHNGVDTTIGAGDHYIELQDLGTLGYSRILDFNNGNPTTSPEGGQWFWIYNKNNSSFRWKTNRVLKFPDQTTTDTLPNNSWIQLRAKQPRELVDTLYVMNVYSGTKLNPSGGGGPTSVFTGTQAQRIAHVASRGDVWYQTDNVKGPYRWTGSRWKYHPDPDYIIGSLGFHNIFMSNSAGGSPLNSFFEPIVAGTAASVGGFPPHYLRLAVGTTTTGQARIQTYRNSTSYDSLYADDYYVEYRVQLPALSVVANTYTAYINTIADIGANINSAGFRYTHGTNGGRWEAISNDDANQTVTDTGISADVNFHVFGVLYESTGSVKFFIDGVLVVTHTTNNPAPPTFNVCAEIRKSAGTFDNEMFIDYINMYKTNEY